MRRPLGGRRSRRLHWGIAARHRRTLRARRTADALGLRVLCAGVQWRDLYSPRYRRELEMVGKSPVWRGSSDTEQFWWLSGFG